jgi:hypothetical protein
LKYDVIPKQLEESTPGRAKAADKSTIAKWGSIEEIQPHFAIADFQRFGASWSGFFKLFRYK